ncbi:SRR1 [Candida metapsilosis]|uniref:Stress response regulator protein 1 n=1 Tax=Candida metapsilosis TaxID=273372 RepID=A0A8H7ZI69_9ASCO|nr:SRR1 [Candida metapsilosis]
MGQPVISRQSSSLPEASLPGTPVKALAKSWHSTSDYFSVKPQLSIEISEELRSTKSNPSGSSDEEHTGDSDYDDDNESDGVSDVMESFDLISLKDEQMFYSPITPLDSSAVPSKSNSLLRKSSILRPTSQDIQQVESMIESMEVKERHQAAAVLASASSSSVKAKSTSSKFNLSMPNLHAYNFLIVDDNVINLKILNRILIKLYPKASIVQAQDSTLVEAIVSKQSFDAIFIDIEMPQVTGLDIANIIRKDVQFDTTSLIAVTTRNSPQDLQLFKRVGIDHTFGKPLNYKLDFMADIIDSIMAQRKDVTNPQTRNPSTTSKSTCATATSAMTTNTSSMDFLDLTALHSVSSISSTDSYTLFESKS